MTTLEGIYRSWVEPYGTLGDVSIGRIHRVDDNLYRLSGPVCGVDIRKLPVMWELIFWTMSQTGSEGLPQGYSKHDDARVAALRWIFQGLWVPV